MNFGFYSIRNKSFLFDLAVVLIDTMIGVFGTAWFLRTLEQGTRLQGIWVLLFFALAIFFYLFAMIRFSPRLGNQNPVEIRDGDWMALIWNCMILGATIPVLISTLFPSMNTTLIVFGFFIIAGGWYYLHFRAFKNMDAEESLYRSDSNLKNPEQTRRRALWMMLPFSAASVIPVNVIVTYGQEAVSDYETAGTKLIGWGMLTFLLALLGWSFAFIPRRMAKALSGIEMKGGGFYWLLAISYFFRLFPF